QRAERGQAWQTPTLGDGGLLADDETTENICVTTLARQDIALQDSISATPSALQIAWRCLITSEASERWPKSFDVAAFVICDAQKRRKPPNQWSRRLYVLIAGVGFEPTTFGL